MYILSKEKLEKIVNTRGNYEQFQFKKCSRSILFTVYIQKQLQHYPEILTTLKKDSVTETVPFGNRTSVYKK